MNRRGYSPVARAVDGLRETVRNGIESLRAVRRSAARSIDARRSVDGADPNRAGDRTETGDAAVAASAARAPGGVPPALVDPDVGPTSRGEVLEYGVSPAEYVRAVVADRGGRMKQRRFADEYGWASSTVSRLLSELEERGAIARYRVGHEKVVALPDGVATERE